MDYNAGCLHTPGRGPWPAMEEHSDAEIAARLYPDQATFRREEQRRFELLDAHWDVPLEERRLPEA